MAATYARNEGPQRRTRAFGAAWSVEARHDAPFIRAILRQVKHCDEAARSEEAATALPLPLEGTGGEIYCSQALPRPAYNHWTYSYFVFLNDSPLRAMR